MDAHCKPSTSLFDVYLRLRPSLNPGNDRFLDVERCDDSISADPPKYITVQPPAESRKRAIERFGFTRVFEQDASQTELFKNTGMVQMIDGVIGLQGKGGRDGLLATLGVTGSGKSHTILGSRTQRGLTQMTLDLLYQSIGHNMVHPTCTTSVYPSLAAEDVSEAQVVPASVLLEAMYGDNQSIRGSMSRAQTPMPVQFSLLPHTPRLNSKHISQFSVELCSSLVRQDSSADSDYDMPGCYPRSRESTPVVNYAETCQSAAQRKSKLHMPSITHGTKSALSRLRYSSVKDASYTITPGIPVSKQRIPRPSALPQTPSVTDIDLQVDSRAEYAIVLSMYEVYNDRIYDLLASPIQPGGKGPAIHAQLKPRRPLLFKSTERSLDRKVVAGLRKVVCATFEEAISVLEIGLYERKVAGTGSNAVSSRSHGFFCVEVKKRDRVTKGPWFGSTLTIVDLAGSERARQAKTAGATLAEAGKINESLMYLGQCMQMQSGNQDGSRNIVPFRQCKLTELLFSNSFPSPSSAANTYPHAPMNYHRNPQKAIMIVTADPTGDFNATSQILRYSALAREVTVPRVPSVTSQILTNMSIPARNHERPASSLTAISTMSNSHNTFNTTTGPAMTDDVDGLLTTITALTEERDIALLQLSEERIRAETLETFISSTDERWADREAEIRDECFAEADAILTKDRRRWKAAWDAEADAADERLDAKVEVMTRVPHHKDNADFSILEDNPQIQELQDEVSSLRARILKMEREKLLLASPTKPSRSTSSKRKPSALDDESNDADKVILSLQDENADLRRQIELVKAAAGSNGGIQRSPSKKLKVLKSKRWEVDLSVDEGL